MLVGSALLLSLLSASVWRSDEHEAAPVADVTPLGGRVPGSQADTKGPSAKESAPATKAWVVPGTGVTRCPRQPCRAPLRLFEVDYSGARYVELIGETTFERLGPAARRAGGGWIAEGSPEVLRGLGPEYFFREGAEDRATRAPAW
ncbi:hypothetical protein [Streptomyces sp. NPDC053367]|uniref:hypothetical protein n=1 Tax=Streptomyces sp. NPDC053367 TaxID=3365700 RepID=UPI0037D58AFC